MTLRPLLAAARLHWRSLVSLVVAVCVVAASALVIALHTASPSRHAAGTTPTASRPAPCPSAVTSSPTAAPERIGSWPLRPVMKGTFVALSAGQGQRLFALEACGTEESSLRVVEIDASSEKVEAYSSRFVRAAPLVSAIAADGASLYVGTSRLALKGSGDAPPYELTVHELSPSTLRQERSLRLGRGYGLSLFPLADGDLLVSTGRELEQITPRGRVTVVASFPGVVVQHAVLVPGTGDVLVSLFTPSALPPKPSSELALVDLRTGAVLSFEALPVGREVESLEVAGAVALVAVENGATSELERVSVAPALSDLPAVSQVLPATLSSVALAPAGGRVFAFGATTMACLLPGTGAVVGSTDPTGASEQASALSFVASREFAVLPGGLYQLRVPTSCA